jgi:hypothetical protein
MTSWNEADLSLFGDAQEVRIAGMRRDGSLRKPVIVWVVRLGDDLYTRSVNGPDAAWFRGAQTLRRGQLSVGGTAIDVDFVEGGGVDDELDAEYQRKYGQYPGPVQAITSPAARSTTLKLVPHQSRKDR